jgi:[acyl-carrier-protein] S-malonyltransferase
MTANKTAFIFPGQGSQYVGMGREFLEEDGGCRDLLAMAEEVSGLPLEKLCLDGPMEDLTRTLHLQPAMTVMNLICRRMVEKAGIKGDFYAGHSLGEYGALAASGVLTPEDTLRLVTERGRLMERESAANPGSMLAVLKLDIDQVEEIVAGITDKGILTAANYNSAKQIVISGEKAALEAAAEEVNRQKGRAVPLPVSGAWHSPLIAGAVPDFTRAITGAEFKRPAGTVYFNVTARPESEPEVIRDIMARQMSSMVRWYDIIINMYEQGVRVFIEVGPKTVLTGLMKKVLPKGHDCKCLQIDSPETLGRCVDELAK